MSVARIVFKAFAGKQFTHSVGLHGLIGMHRALAESLYPERGSQDNGKHEGKGKQAFL